MQFSSVCLVFRIHTINPMLVRCVECKYSCIVYNGNVKKSWYNAARGWWLVLKQHIVYREFISGEVYPFCGCLCCIHIEILIDFFVCPWWVKFHIWRLYIVVTGQGLDEFVHVLTLIVSKVMFKIVNSMF